MDIDQLAKARKILGFPLTTARFSLVLELASGGVTIDYRKGREGLKGKAKREQADGAGHMVWLPRLMGIAYPRVLGDGKEGTARTFYNAKGV